MVWVERGVRGGWAAEMRRRGRQVLITVGLVGCGRGLDFILRAAGKSLEQTWVLEKISVATEDK